MSKKLYFKHGTMGSGKSLDMIRAIYNYKERGMRVLVYKSATDTRNGAQKCVVSSRASDFSVDAKWLPEKKSLYEMIAADIIKAETKRVFIDYLGIKAIFVDESQFLTELQVDELQEICYRFNIPVMCYGLLTDFQRHLFPGSKRLMEIADDTQELIGICHCGSRARQNARVVNGVMVTDGEIVKIGKSNTDGKEDEVYYTALCNKCYISKEVGN